jgi:hypothetical protein
MLTLASPLAGFGHLMCPLDVLRGLSVLTRSGTKVVPRLVLRLTYLIYGQVDVPVTNYGQVDVPTFSQFRYRKGYQPQTQGKFC